MSIRPRIAQLPGYDYKARSGRVKLDQNELPDDIPDEVRAAFLERVARVTFNRYPDLTATGLRERLAEAFDWPAEGVLVSPGSNVLIRCLVIAAGIEQAVLTPTPTFGVYAQQAQMLGARLVEVPMEPGFRLPVGALLNEMEGRRGVLFIANPAAPTGNLHSREEIERVVEAAGEGWTVVLDEAYCQFAGSDLRDLARRPGVLTLRTLSKAFGLAGARVGFALASPELARDVAKTLLPFCVSELQQAAAHTLLDFPQLLEQRVERTVTERERLQRELARLDGVTAFPSVTNFILFKVADALAVYERLLDAGVIVRRQNAGSEGEALRVTVGSPAENDEFLAALAAALREVKRA